LKNSDSAVGYYSYTHDLKKSRPDADRVHSDGFYFFNLNIHRTMILVEFDDDEASVVWVGTHLDYEKVFKNNINTIKKWLRVYN
jgi:mRNA interferase HigB